MKFYCLLLKKNFMTMINFEHWYIMVHLPFEMIKITFQQLPLPWFPCPHSGLGQGMISKCPKSVKLQEFSYVAVCNKNADLYQTGKIFIISLKRIMAFLHSICLWEVPIHSEGCLSVMCLIGLQKLALIQLYKMRTQSAFDLGL